MTLKSALRFGLLWGTVIIGGAFVWRALEANWSRLDLTLTPAHLGGLGVVLMAYTAGMMTLPWGAQVMQRWYGRAMSPHAMWRAFFVSQLSKYLPGGIWSVLGRAFFYQQAGLPPRETGALVLLELIGLVIAAVLVGLLGVPALWPWVQATDGWLVLAIALAGAVGVAGATLTRRRWLPAFAGVRLRDFVGVCLRYVVTWLMLGAAFGLVVLALGQALTPLQFVAAIGVHAVAWLVGFLVVFAPGGIGVRDAILAAGLAPFVPMPLPLAISVLARLAWTLAEVFCVGLCWVLPRR